MLTPIVRLMLLATVAVATPPLFIPCDVAPTGVGRITGHVRDAARQPIAGAQVVVVGTSFGAVTNQSGEYAITSVPEGAYSVRARYIGYTPVEVHGIRVTSGGTTTADFALQASAVHLDAVVATGLAEGRQSAKSMAATVYGYADRDETAYRVRREPWNTEEYGHKDENQFLAVSAHPLSTFSIDVDRASYSNVRRFLLGGQAPPVDAVRLEELVNYFPYDYAEPTGDDPVAIHTELGAAPWKQGHQLLRIGLQAKRVAVAGLPASNLVFLIDVSGSMDEPNKLPLVQSALTMLVNTLRPQDRVAIVVYAGSAGLVLPSTPGDQKSRILAAIDSLEAGGSTAGGAGIKRAYDEAVANFIRGGNNRVILATDGDFNVGVSSDGELIRLIEDRRKTGVFLTVLGFGMGNLKDSKMEQLADHGNGNYAYIDNALEAKKTLVHEMGGTLYTVAKDVKIQVEFNPAVVQGYRLLGYENRLLADEDFNDDTKDAGEMGSGHSVTALYEIIPAGAPSDGSLRGTDPLRYQANPTPRDAPRAPELGFVKVRYKTPDGDRSRLLSQAISESPTATASPDFRFQEAVAEFGLLLKNSQFKGSASFTDAIAAARAALGADPDGYRAEFVRLAAAAQSLGLARTEEPR
ncbi:MAG TPA: von Willebrand factor type A domain-containing protein [Gemmatimonadales bacterium]|nr:von Willebrand factor type A domain-containing protein [Gemmatimonadales bacterium]